MTRSSAAEWWKGFNASRLRRGCSAGWRSGFDDARDVERRLEGKAATGQKPYNPDLCINCFGPIPSVRQISALMCCDACQQIAEGVRGLRRWVSKPGNVLNMDEIAQRQRFVCCAISKDGYGKRARQVSPDLRDNVFKRAGYRCELCGRPRGNSFESMLTIQHMRGSSNDPSDLKAYCRQCNTIEALRFVAPSQLGGYSAEQLKKLNIVVIKNPDALREPRVERLMREIQLRVLSDTPVIPCDDASAWKHRYGHLQAKRRDHIRAARSRSSDLRTRQQ